MPVEPIRVELEAFCQKFTSALEPFNAALEQGTDSLREAVDSDALQTVLGDLQDNRHRLKILLDKARQQNTYLVIFGPLKSGKSTLMNAISGAYVSEVSSLPAYPCLVYVKEGEEHGFSTTAFNGDRIDYNSRDQLHGSLEKAHTDLARRIREAEAADTPFNPAQDFTEAIRRIDFTMPAPYLQESGTILVDTPGLYTKMRYSYGQLTRDFRDTAACAVFVVKTDNLFFEQVFEEFADLLEVFSRVFLVVNIDSSKQDLGPDGSLEPSLEQHDPKRIVEAFENLTVSAQIRSAIDSGRLRIYMIDLLQTAARSLKGEVTIPTPSKKEDDTTDEAGKPDDVPESNESEATNEDDDSPSPAKYPFGNDAHAPAVSSDNGPTPAGDQTDIGFEGFLGDLTEYLNSSEYIVEFMADSLRQSRSILLEVKDRVRAPEISEFRTSIETYEKRFQHAQQQLEAIDHLQANLWEGPLEELSREIWQQVTEHTGSTVPKLEKALHSDVEAWVQTDESVCDLLENRIIPKIKSTCEASRKRAIELFDGACRARDGGVRLSNEVAQLLRELDIAFDDIYLEFQPTVRERLEAAPELMDSSGLQEALPLRRRFIDWLLLRTETRLRKHVLGTENPSEKPIPATVKAKRMDEESIRTFCGSIGEYARGSSINALEGEMEPLLREYQEVFQAEAKKRLAGKREIISQEHAEARRQHELRVNVLETLDTLDTASDELDLRATELREQFVTGKQSRDSVSLPEESESKAPDASTNAEEAPESR